MVNIGNKELSKCCLVMRKDLKELKSTRRMFVGMERVLDELQC